MWIQLDRAAPHFARAHLYRFSWSGRTRPRKFGVRWFSKSPYLTSLLLLMVVLKNAVLDVQRLQEKNSWWKMGGKRTHYNQVPQRKQNSLRPRFYFSVILKVRFKTIVRFFKKSLWFSNVLQSWRSSSSTVLLKYRRVNIENLTFCKSL